MKSSVVILSIILLSLLSCATYRFTPVADESKNFLRIRGTTTPVYENTNIVIAILPKYIESNIALRIVIRNISAGMISFSDTDFEVYSSNDKINWKRVETYTSEQYFKKENDAYNAGRRTSSTSGSFYGNTADGSFSGTYQSNTSNYDPVAAELTRQRDQRNIQNYSDKVKTWLIFLQNNLFYTVDLESQKEYSGLIFCQNSYDIYFKVILKSADVPITFYYLREKVD